MQGKRTDRVGHLLQMELGQIISTKLRDPRLGFVTVTHVGMSADLRSAVVFYSVIGSDKDRENTQKALEKAAGFLQKEIAAAIELRNTPKLQFRLDESVEKGIQIDRIIHDIKGEERDS